MANRQFDLGVDVIYAAAGGTGIGVYLVAKGRGKLAIGVDANQNYLYPGTMLTSMIKRVDVAVHDAFMSAKSGTWKSGTVVLGLKEDGVGFALDEYNRNLISPAMEARMEQAPQGHHRRQDQGYRLHGFKIVTCRRCWGGLTGKVGGRTRKLTAKPYQFDDGRSHGWTEVEDASAKRRTTSRLLPPRQAPTRGKPDTSDCESRFHALIIRPSAIERREVTTCLQDGA